MSDPHYTQRYVDIFAADARGRFECVSWVLYKVLVRAIEIDDPHVLSYEWVKYALMILAEGPNFEVVNEYLRPDGTITLEGADKFCNYATTAISLLGVSYRVTEVRTDDVLAVREKLRALFGRHASTSHVRTRCFELMFRVNEANNVIRWSGKLFSELADACGSSNDPRWIDHMVKLFKRVHGRVMESDDALYSARRENNRLVRELHRSIHYEAERDMILETFRQLRETSLATQAVAKPKEKRQNLRLGCETIRFAAGLWAKYRFRTDVIKVKKGRRISKADVFWHFKGQLVKKGIETPEDYSRVINNAQHQFPEIFRTKKRVKGLPLKR